MFSNHGAPPSFFKRGILLLSFVGTACVTSKPQLPRPETIAFGSCNKQVAAQPLWNTIDSHKPDFFIWLGDVVYTKDDSISTLKSALQSQNQLQNYKQFRNSTKVIGVWDDHDFHNEHPNRTAPEKTERQELFLDFLKEPKQSNRRSQDGIYQDYHFSTAAGPVHLFLLDTRYHKDPWGREAKTILGEMQWTWLEHKLKIYKDGIHIFASSIQILPNAHRFDHWGRIPKERQRFLDALANHDIQTAIVISGDRHIAELSYLPSEDSGLPRGIWELTSSGLTHSYDSFKGERNPFRKQDVFFNKNFGLIHFSKEALELEVRDQDNKVRIKQTIKIQ